MSGIVAFSVAAVHEAATIPYRENSAVPAGSLAWAVLVTMLVLGAIVGVLLLARRQGWLKFWTGRSRLAKPDGSAWKVTARIRLSATARAYVLENTESSYLVVESSQHLAVQPQPRARGEDHAGEG